MYAARGRRRETTMLGTAFPVWGWWAVVFLFCAGFRLWRSRRRARAGIPTGEDQGPADYVAEGGAVLSLLLLVAGAFLAIVGIDLGRILGGTF